MSDSIYIGDHVWIGQHVFILKGTNIGSGSIIGSMSTISGKRIESNAIYAGNPVRLIKENVFFIDKCSHSYLDTDIEKSMYSYNFGNDTNTEYLYRCDENTESFNLIESRLNALDLDEKIKYLKSINNSKNRFAIEKVFEKQTFLKKIKRIISNLNS